MKKIIILTGDEYRHIFFRKTIASKEGINVLASYCEGLENSLENKILSNTKSSHIEKLHINARTQSEIDFFGDSINMIMDKSRPIKIKSGQINDVKIVNEIMTLNPDLLICYGSSLIRSELLNTFQGRFLNVHLGLSPYYRGSGTNIWPLINKEPYMVGATFMHIDAGIDTGKIIHQIRANIFMGDSPHSIGNRLIRSMTEVYYKLISSFDSLGETENHLHATGKLYANKDFDEVACKTLYQNFNEGMIESFLTNRDHIKIPPIIKNRFIERIL